MNTIGGGFPDGNEENGCERPKSTHKTGWHQKTPTGQDGKAPTRRRKEAPLYYEPVCLSGVVGLVELRILLKQHGQHEWTRLRCFGLLLLLDWLCRPKSFTDHTERNGARGVLCSSDLAEQYASSIKRPRSRSTILEPLAVLCKIGILERTAKATFAHARLSARYALATPYRNKVQKLTVELPPCLRGKLQSANERKDKRLDRKYPFRKQLLADLCLLKFPDSCRPRLARLRKDGKGGGGLAGITHAIDLREHFVKVSVFGTIHTAFSSVPRELKPMLTLCEVGVTICDISHAHHCFLPRVLRERILYCEKHSPSARFGDLGAEREALIERLSSGDYYSSWCESPSDQKERGRIKKLATQLLNMRPESCRGIPLYCRMRAEFPNLFSTIEDINGRNNRNLSKQLQRFTSNAINGALWELQGQGIPCLPDTDSIVCRAPDHQRVSAIIGKWVFAESGGVRCKVGGHRYERPSSTE